MIIAKFARMIEDEVVGHIFDGGLGEVGLVHDRGVGHLGAPFVSLECVEGPFFTSTLTVGGNHVEGLLLEGFGQTDHSWSELTAAHSSTPNDEEGDFALQVSRAIDLGTSPVLSPVNILGSTLDLGVVLLARVYRQR